VRRFFGDPGLGRQSTVSATADRPVAASVEQLQEAALAIQDELAGVIVGYEDVLRGVLVPLLAGGSTLLEGALRLGKTLLVRTLGQILQLKYSRIQFTPDLMPADIIGTNVLVESDTGHRRFVFQPGAVFGNLILADAINRASPKTQSALLEAMQENSVTVGAVAYPLPLPFFELATQNPIEMAGTYPLPEAQLDRFLFKLKADFPSNASLTQILLRTTAGPAHTVRCLADSSWVLGMRRVARQAPIASNVLVYAVRLVAPTQPTREEAPRRCANTCATEPAHGVPRDLSWRARSWRSCQAASTSATKTFAPLRIRRCAIG
jgi:MoxR-like ATPase